jgi:putative acetyltransferase
LTGSDEPFLSRWSRRKLEARSGARLPDGQEAPSEKPAGAAPHAEPRRSTETGGEGRDTAAGKTPPECPEAAGEGRRPARDFSNFDFSKLDRNSDYTQFMAPDVPPDVRSKALSRLWLSDPILSRPDELHDYLDDFTDAAKVPKGRLETAYRIGRGFLSDDEVAAWDRLGRPDVPAPPPAVVIAQESPRQPEVTAMLADSDAYAESLYPPESNHLVGVSVLAAPNATFLVARRGGRAVGCAALIDQGDGSGELKRMWVIPDERRGGIGRKLLDAIEARALEKGLSVLRLETGVRQEAAIRLYERYGFVRCEPFGSYRPDPLSLYMEKRLSRAG